MALRRPRQRQDRVTGTEGEARGGYVGQVRGGLCTQDGEEELSSSRHARRVHQPEERKNSKRKTLRESVPVSGFVIRQVIKPSY